MVLTYRYCIYNSSNLRDHVTIAEWTLRLESYMAHQVLLLVLVADH
jgi:hypothetical protein